MIKKKISFLFIVFVILNNGCSFDSPETGIWGDAAKEREKITKLEKTQKETVKVEKIYSSDEYF